jgi:SAICAR synthetase
VLIGRRGAPRQSKQDDSEAEEMASPCICRVNLLVASSNAGGGDNSDDDEDVRFARDVCENLSQQFGVNNVVLRSAQLPLEDWISYNNDQYQESDASKAFESEMLVFLSATQTPAASSSLLDRECPFPVLTIDRALTSAADAALTIAKWCSLSSEDTRRQVHKALEIRKQARRTLDAQLRTTSPSYANAIANCYDAGATVTGDSVSLPGRVRGKVRDRYGGAQEEGSAPAKPPLLALVTTDRQSGFDRMLAQVPYKGAVLNLTSAFWFQHTSHIISNHLVSIPHPNVSIVKQCTPFPVEFVVRYVLHSRQTRSHLYLGCVWIEDTWWRILAHLRLFAAART